MICPKCKQDKDESLFFKNSAKKNGLTTYCKICHKLNQKPKTREQKDRYNQKSRNTIYNQRWKFKNPSGSLFNQARNTAKKRSMEFNLELEDLSVPEFCPILNIPLFFTPGKRTNNTPSIDRIDNSKGYIKGNVCVISWRANQLKRDCTFQEIESIYKYMKEKICDVL